MNRTRAIVVSIVTATLRLMVMPVPIQADNFSIGINVGAPPPLVVVPGTPVYYAPSVSVNFFAYGGRYYSHHNGAWFMATTYNGPWNFVAVERVPQPVLAVPVAYYKVPPGHMKKVKGGGPPPWAGHGREHKHKWIDD
ncbi:MAG: hypothetical protein KGJ40_09195 [candidate division NC10 bacterium]|nr:hypothetical protein [candidate division NC10 bacterium]MDE2485127.1 hypothetical protein [candidate division NC10 bacterium]